MTFWSWSRTAATNATADSTINWAEGQAPSSINDSARAVMAAAAKYRDDIAGAIVTGGTLTAYTVTSYEVFDTLAHLNGQMIAFTPHATNGDTVTLNVDGLGAKPLRSAPSTELVAGTLVQGTPYVAVYNSSDAVFYLQGYFSSPYNVPFLGGMDFWDTVTPNSSFIFPAGQAISRTVYSRAFARWGTQFGVGNGSTTFNVPDKTGRVSAMIEAAPTRLTNLSSGNSTILGGTGGADTQTLTAAQIPPLTSTGANTISVNSSTTVVQNASTVGLTPTGSGGFGYVSIPANAVLNSTGSNSISVTTTGTSGNSHPIVQPTITCNYIIRIL